MRVLAIFVVVPHLCSLLSSTSWLVSLCETIISCVLPVFLVTHRVVCEKEREVEWLAKQKPGHE